MHKVGENQLLLGCLRQQVNRAAPGLFCLGLVLSVGCQQTVIREQCRADGTSVEDGLPTDTRGQPLDSEQTGADLLTDAHAPDDAETWDDSATHDAAHDAEPDSPDASLAARVVLSEVACHGDDFVELHNEGSSPANLSAWRISDGPGNGHTYTFPAGTTLASGGYLVVYEASGGAGLPFGLSCGADELVLQNEAGDEMDRVMLPLVMDGYSHSRLPSAAGGWGDGTLTPGLPNTPAPDLDALLFDPLTVRSIKITMPQASIDSLWVDSATYVPGTFTLEAGADVHGPVPVGLRIKGKYGSFQTLDGKSALKVKFNYEAKGQRFRGLKKLTLNNMVQDPSMIHEVLAYRLFRAMGVPCPRTGYAWVTVNGKPYGLYLTLEAYDDVSMTRHFVTTEHLYEGEYGLDVIPEHAGLLEIDEGDGDFDDLLQLATASVQAPEGQWLDAVSLRGDVQRWVAMWAVELFTGHWDGYAPTINNYYLHSDKNGMFTMLPNGTDQTFSAWMGYYDGYGNLFVRCKADATCLGLYRAALSKLPAALAEADLDSLAAQVSESIAVWAQQDPRKPYSYWDVQVNQQGTRDFIAGRWAELEGLVGCWTGPDADQDGDGFICEQDCDEGDPTTHQGAYDACGDGLDQDCNGTPDDAYECPDCVEVLRGSRLYHICPTYRPWEEAAAHCGGLGSRIVQVDGQEEGQWLAEAMGILGVAEGWLAMRDDAVEGQWTDVTGQPVTWYSWGGGQPDNWGDSEDCAEVFSSGEWNDVACWDSNPVLCERTCEPGVDSDCP